MSTTFKVRITNGTEQIIVGDDDDLLLVKPVSARWFNSDWEAATGLHLESEDEGTVGQITPEGYTLPVCLQDHRNMILKMLDRCSDLNLIAYDDGFTANRPDSTAIRAGVIPQEAFQFIELLHRSIRLMEIFQELALNEVHVTVFWS